MMFFLFSGFQSQDLKIILNPYLLDIKFLFDGRIAWLNGSIKFCASVCRYKASYTHMTWLQISSHTALIFTRRKDEEALLRFSLNLENLQR